MVPKKKTPTKVEETKSEAVPITQPESEPHPEEQLPVETISSEPREEPIEVQETVTIAEEVVVVDLKHSAQSLEPTPTTEPAEFTPIPTGSLTLEALQAEVELLWQVVKQQGQQIADLQNKPKPVRKPMVSNGKIQIRDKKTGIIYKSKNNVYQSLLKAGELKESVDKGVFGADPEKNSFGCYNLFRAWPDRFEEVKTEKPADA